MFLRFDGGLKILVGASLVSLILPALCALLEGILSVIELVFP